MCILGDLIKYNAIAICHVSTYCTIKIFLSVRIRDCNYVRRYSCLIFNVCVSIYRVPWYLELFFPFLQKCKKIFDPADHDQPSRKRKVSDSSAAPGNGQSTLNSTAALSGLGLNRGTSQITVGSKSLTIRTTSATKSNKNISNDSNSPSSSNSMRSLAINRENACMYCGLDTPKHKKGRIEHLLKCKDCVNIGESSLHNGIVALYPPTKWTHYSRLLIYVFCLILVHPSCMDYCEELTRKIMSMPWQCNNCKTCFVCKEENDDVSYLAGFYFEGATSNFENPSVENP